jgi:ABC transporter substrate binding protein (PQQ-dependent alcohol dehydrogenase system)
MKPTFAKWGKALVCTVLTCAGLTAQARDLTIGIVFDPEDARYESKRLDKSYPGQPLGRPKAGAELAIAESEFQLAQGNLKVTLQDVPAESVQDARAQIEALGKKGVRHFLLDLPGATAAELSKALRQSDILLFNVSAPEANLRRAACSANLFHTLPDDAMMTDAIAQYLTFRKWTRVLLLTSQVPADASLIAAAQQAIKRYGIKVVAAKPFKLSNDPRERDMGNVALLTAGIDADVVWVVDADGEFARDVPYRTVLPRPVVGSAGLVPEAWAMSWERYGAPQLSRRFKKATNRAMAGPDWAAWIATKAVIEVALKLPDARAHRRALRSQELVLDGFKGARLSFRPWDQQLRQPVFLAHGGIGGGVAGVAPIEGFLHPKNNLDTLGADEKESPCKLTDGPAAPGEKK